MKVIQINTVNTGSTGKIALSIHEYLKSKNIDSYFFYGIGKNVDNNVKKFTNMFEIHIHAVLSKIFGLQGYFSIFATFRLLRIIKKINPNIIHLHNYHGSYLNFKMLLKFVKKNNIPFIITMHDCLIFTGKCPHYSKINCQRWKEKCGKCVQKKRYPKSLFFDFSKKILLDKKKYFNSIENICFVAVSDWLKNEAMKSYLNAKQIVRIYNGININVFKPIESNNIIEIQKEYNLQKKFVILSVASSWNYDKGLKQLIDLSKLLTNDEIIFLVGISNELVSKLPDNIVGINKTENIHDLIDIYNMADVCISCSLEETFGLTIIEAMACGTPCVVFKSTALPELIDDGIQGYIVEPNNIVKMYESIEIIKKNGKKYYFNNCINNVKRNFDVNYMNFQYFELYKRMLIRRNKKNE